MSLNTALKCYFNTHTHEGDVCVIRPGAAVRDSAARWTNITNNRGHARQCHRPPNKPYVPETHRFSLAATVLPPARCVSYAGKLRIVEQAFEFLADRGGTRCTGALWYTMAFLKSLVNKETSQAFMLIASSLP